MKATTDYSLVAQFAQHDVTILKEKGESYGDSWKKRGGVGAYMMLARKWDRIELATEKEQWDVFQAIMKGVGRRADPLEEIDDLLGDIRDLRRYLLLVEAEFFSQKEETPGIGYVNQ